MKDTSPTVQTSKPPISNFKLITPTNLVKSEGKKESEEKLDN